MPISVCFSKKVTNLKLELFCRSLLTFGKKITDKKFNYSSFQLNSCVCSFQIVSSIQLLPLNLGMCDFFASLSGVMGREDI